MSDEVHRQLLICEAQFLFTTSGLAPIASQATRGTQVKVVVGIFHNKFGLLLQTQLLS